MLDELMGTERDVLLIKERVEADTTRCARHDRDRDSKSVPNARQSLRARD